MSKEKQLRQRGNIQNLLENERTQKVFETKPGDKMYKTPEDRIKIW